MDGGGGGMRRRNVNGGGGGGGGMTAEKPAEKLMTVVRKMDMYSKVDADFKVTTTTGGYLSIAVSE